VNPVPDPQLFFLVVPGIEPGPPDLLPRTLTTRPQRRSWISYSVYNNGLFNDTQCVTLNIANFVRHFSHMSSFGTDFPPLFILLVAIEIEPGNCY
jgi:hypothetical protein